MKSGPELNTFQPQTWARVVSSVGWADYALDAGGTLKAELKRGPLIIFSEDGEEKSPIHGQAPTLSPLERRVLEVNTRSHFERFRLAARGKVRHSVRWKTGRRVKERVKCSALDYAYEAARILRGEGIYSGPSWSLQNTREGWRQYVAYWRREKFFRMRRSIAGKTGVLEVDGNIYQTLANDWDKWEKILKILSEIKDSPKLSTFLGAIKSYPLSTLLIAARIKGDTRIIRALVKALRQPSLVISPLIRALQSAEYLSHVRRKVKPAPRRGRIPRPAHAVPRPPTAPLAPPVTY